ncbi:uncharacterized protein DUF669 [Scopulibacillus darangshiensis]|uniref:Uncharacterized protein DUF669 n=1 Tax=Scopulibacillus darangshiensis TaxID=442528 RepID=A0A4R2PCK9_9BACL|nr:DUF669 domain-containing protein [Scopulibacillus darangshiensis]TCP32158.1 uncharacterized protein DUF669 [Scopulibacillus darangshiensis]
MFKIDHSQVKEFEPIKPGEYEVIPVNYELKTAKSGSNMVVVDYEIRSDVDQPNQGQKILYDNFVVTENSMWRFQSASKAAQFPDGVEFSSYKEWADAFINKPLRVVVGEQDGNNGKKYPQVNVFKESEAAPMEQVNISESDVPF